MVAIGRYLPPPRIRWDFMPETLNPSSKILDTFAAVLHIPRYRTHFPHSSTFQDIEHICCSPAHSKILDTLATILHISRYWTFLPHYCDLTMLILIIKLVMWIRIRWKANRILDPHQPPCGLLQRRKISP